METLESSIYLEELSYCMIALRDYILAILPTPCLSLLPVLPRVEELTIPRLSCWIAWSHLPACLPLFELYLLISWAEINLYALIS